MRKKKEKEKGRGKGKGRKGSGQGFRAQLFALNVKIGQHMIDGNSVCLIGGLGGPPHLSLL